MSPTHNIDQLSRGDLTGLIDQLKMFADIDGRMQVSTILGLLYVALEDSKQAKPELNTKDLGEMLGVVSSAATRQTYYWGPGLTKLDPETGEEKNTIKGQGFINVEIGRYDRRYKALSMTPKGWNFVRRLFSAKSEGDSSNGETAGSGMAS